jgi:hypothetical protein
MSKRNVELTRRFFEAYNAHDIEAFIACFDPSAEFHSVFAAVGGMVYHGHDGLREYFRDMVDTWGDEIRADPEAYFDVAERPSPLPCSTGAEDKAVPRSRCRLP